MKWLSGHRICWICLAFCLVCGALDIMTGNGLNGWFMAACGWVYAGITEWQRENYL